MKRANRRNAQKVRFHHAVRTAGPRQPQLIATMSGQLAASTLFEFCVWFEAAGGSEFLQTQHLFDVVTINYPSGVGADVRTGADEACRTAATAWAAFHIRQTLN